MLAETRETIFEFIIYKDTVVILTCPFLIGGLLEITTMIPLTLLTLADLKGQSLNNHEFSESKYSDRRGGGGEETHHTMTVPNEHIGSIIGIQNIPFYCLKTKFIYGRILCPLSTTGF